MSERTRMLSQSRGFTVRDARTRGHWIALAVGTLLSCRHPSGIPSSPAPSATPIATQITRPSSGPAPSSGGFDSDAAAPNEISSRSSGLVHEKPLSKKQARRRVEALPELSNAGRLRVIEMEDATTIDLGCTGSWGECMYWFKVERPSAGKWAFWRYFIADPYSKRLYISTTPDLEEARRGPFQPVLQSDSGASE